MRLPRMTTRRWMVAVVIVGLVMGGVVGTYRLKRRHSDFLSRADVHDQIAVIKAKMEHDAREEVDWLPKHIATFERSRRYGLPSGPTLDRLKARLERSRQQIATLSNEIAYHRAMARKYRHAARYPWLPVAPDPPKPGRTPSGASGEPSLIRTGGRGTMSETGPGRRTTGSIRPAARTDESGC